MTWTDERVELLKRLWAEGLSASQIAAELGGVTRNAVIGKVHRLGLSGREKPNAPGVAKPRRTVSAPARPTPRPMPMFRGNAALALAPDAPVAPKPMTLPQPSPVSAPVIEFVGAPVTIMDLREGMCRWPMGDPSSSEFRFCGCRTADVGSPYCSHHATIAYQPVNDRRRDKRVLERAAG
jgi:GcrA cell cycle regulator